MESSTRDHIEHWDNCPALSPGINAMDLQEICFAGYSGPAGPCYKEITIGKLFY